MSDSQRPDRRSFLTAVGALSGVALFPKLSRAETGTTPLRSARAPWDLTWLDKFQGKHRQVFDFERADLKEGNHLLVVRNYLNAHKEVFNLDFPDVNTAVGITYDAYPLNASDALWEKFPIGEIWKITDPRTRTWAKRNVFADPDQSGPKGAFSVPAIKARGTAFWQCNNAFGRVVGDIATAIGRPNDAVRADLLAGMMPEVHLVPAHTMLIGLAQEHGFTYQSIG
jgi:hypothetical protein